MQANAYVVAAPAVTTADKTNMPNFAPGFIVHGTPHNDTTTSQQITHVHDEHAYRAQTTGTHVGRRNHETSLIVNSGATHYFFFDFGRYAQRRRRH